MKGIYDGIRTSEIAIGPVVVKGAVDGMPSYRGRLNAEAIRVLKTAGRIPVKTKDAGYLAQKGRVGEEDGEGHAYIADNLTGVTKKVAADHERIGAAMSLLGKGHDDTAIARMQLGLYSEVGDSEAYMLTLRGARNAEWINHDEFLNYMKEAYEAGLITR